VYKRQKADPSRVKEVLAAYDLKPREFSRLKQIHKDKGIHDKQTGAKKKLDKISLQDKSITFTEGKKVTTENWGKVNTQKENERNIDKVIMNFLEGSDKAMVDLKKVIKNGFNPSMDKLLKLTNGAESSRVNALIGAFGLDSKQFERLKEIHEEKGIYTPSNNTREKLDKINIKDKTVTFTKDGKEATMKWDKVHTEKEHQLHIQSLSKSKVMNKAVGLNK